jgi:hypothetical protein
MQTFSSESSPTVWRIIPSLEFLIKRWDSMSTQSQYRDVQAPLREGIASLQKWYHRVDDMLLAYFICLGKVQFASLSSSPVVTFVLLSSP